MGIAVKHLSESERISIAKSLFEVKSEDSNKKELHGLCPIHGEENPSFSYNYNKDVYNCLACGASGDLAGLWAKVKGYDSKDGFKAFCEHYSIETGSKKEYTSSPKKNPGKDKEKPEQSSPERSLPNGSLDDVWALLSPLPESWENRLTEIRGWSKETIKRIDIRIQTHYQDKKGKVHKVEKPDRIAIPVKDRQGVVRNIRLYKPGAKVRKIISWGRSYGSARLFPPAPLPGDGPVLLCEGEPDTICAISYGFDAITQTSKTKKWGTRQNNLFRGRDVIIAYDADQAGQKYAGFAAENLCQVAKSIRMLKWPDFMGRQANGKWPDDHGQDLTDFFINHGKSAQDLQELFTTAKPYETPKEASTPSSQSAVMQFFAYGVNDRLSFKPRLLAERILKDISILSEPETGLIYKWNNRFWETFTEDHIKNLCLRYLGDESKKNWAEDATFQARILSTIPHGRTVNDNPDYVCVKNGMLNLKTLDLTAHDRDYFSTYELGVKFNPDSEARCDQWMGYLDKSVKTPAAIAQLQEFAGYCLTRDTRYAKCLFLIGPGSDGKSVFLKTLRKLVGPENCSAVSFQDLEDQFLRSSIYGKLLNISTEVGHKALESPYFKAIVTGDPINAAFKHKNAFSFTPYCKLTFAANKLPRVLDNSDGFFRRLLPIQFKQQFMGDDDDSHLEEKLEKELSEIFHWALVGLHRLWEQEGFTDSDETRQLLMDYRRLNNPVVCFVEDQCVIDESYSASKKDLYKNYREYSVANGYSIMNKENFFRELYSAISNLRQYRPQINGVRECHVKGIGLEVVFDE